MEYLFNKNNLSLIIYTVPQVFGNGQHETTQFMIDLITMINIKNKTVIDIGCGTGILSVLCAKLGAKHVLALDIDLLALEWTRKNSKRNDVNIETEIHDFHDSLDEKTDIILANLPPAESHENARLVYDNLNEGGYFITTWFKNEPFSLPGFEIIQQKTGELYDAYLLKKIYK